MKKSYRNCRVWWRIIILNRCMLNDWRIKIRFLLLNSMNKEFKSWRQRISWEFHRRKFKVKWNHSIRRTLISGSKISIIKKRKKLIIIILMIKKDVYQNRQIKTKISLLLVKVIVWMLRGRFVSKKKTR